MNLPMLPSTANVIKSIITAIIMGKTQYPRVDTLAKKDNLVPSSLALAVTIIDPRDMITNVMENTP